MLFKVSVIVPFKTNLDELLNPFQGRFTDSMVWDHQGKEAKCVWFESRHPELLALLAQALMSDQVWEYSIRKASR